MAWRAGRERRKAGPDMPLDLLLSSLWRRKGTICLGWIALLLAGATIVLLLPQRYVARATVAPLETTNIATSTLLSSGPLFQAGLLDNKPSGNFAIYLGALRSREAAAMLLRNTTLGADLLERMQESIPGQVVRAISCKLFDLCREPEVTLDTAMGWLERNLSVGQSPVNITWQVEVQHRDRALSQDILRRLHAFAEDKVRGELKEMVERRLKVLQARADAEPDGFLRNTLYDLIAQQQRAQMVVEADQAVAALLVSRPDVEIEPSQPNRPLLLILLIPATLMLSVGGAAALILLRGPAMLPRRAVFAGDD
jgi:hypothetical protein